VHTALAGVALRAVCGGGLVDDALLHDGAVHGEAVGGGFGGFAGGGGGDEGLEDAVLGVEGGVSLRWEGDKDVRGWCWCWVGF
jgi:hypothetical protein